MQADMTCLHRSRKRAWECAAVSRISSPQGKRTRPEGRQWKIEPKHGQLVREIRYFEAVLEIWPTNRGVDY